MLTPLAPLQDLFSLFAAFPQGGTLAASESLDRRQCQIRSDEAQVSRGEICLFQQLLHISVRLHPRLELLCEAQPSEVSSYESDDQ